MEVISLDASAVDAAKFFCQIAPSLVRLRLVTIVVTATSEIDPIIFTFIELLPNFEALMIQGSDVSKYDTERCINNICSRKLVANKIMQLSINFLRLADFQITLPKSIKNLKNMLMFTDAEVELDESSIQLLVDIITSSDAKQTFSFLIFKNVSALKQKILLKLIKWSKTLKEVTIKQCTFADDIKDILVYVCAEAFIKNRHQLALDNIAHHCCRELIQLSKENNNLKMIGLTVFDEKAMIGHYFLDHCICEIGNRITVYFYLLQCETNQNDIKQAVLNCKKRTTEQLHDSIESLCLTIPTEHIYDELQFNELKTRMIPNTIGSKLNLIVYKDINTLGNMTARLKEIDAVCGTVTFGDQQSKLRYWLPGI